MAQLEKPMRITGTQGENKHGDPLEDADRKPVENLWSVKNRWSVENAIQKQKKGKETKTQILTKYKLKSMNMCNTFVIFFESWFNEI